PAERAGALAAVAHGRAALRREQLHPGLEQRAREIVAASIGIPRPVDQEPRAGGLRVVLQPRTRLIRQLGRTRRRMAEERLGAGEEGPHLLVEIGAEGLRGERARQLALRAVEARRETQRRLGRGGLRSEQLGPLRALRQAREDVSACGRHPSLAGTTWDGAAAPIPW